MAKDDMSAKEQAALQQKQSLLNEKTQRAQEIERLEGAIKDVESLIDAFNNGAREQLSKVKAPVHWEGSVYGKYRDSRFDSVWQAMSRLFADMGAYCEALRIALQKKRGLYLALDEELVDLSKRIIEKKF